MKKIMFVMLLASAGAFGFGKTSNQISYRMGNHSCSAFNIWQDRKSEDAGSWALSHESGAFIQGFLTATSYFYNLNASSTEKITSDLIAFCKQNTEKTLRDAAIDQAKKLLAH
jgi:hypothetical protein